MATVLQLNPIPEAPSAPVDPLVALVDRAITAEKPNMEQITTIYLKLRGAERDLKEKARAKIAPITAGMERIEAFLLAKMNELGVDSLKNEAGTPYKSERVTISVADNAAFVDFVLDRALQALPVSEEARASIVRAIVDSGQFALIEARASKTAVEALLEETGELPPGLNRRSENTVNVRAS